MTKYHINKQGLPAPCKAQKGNCPFGGGENHYDTINQAQQAADKINQKQFGIITEIDTLDAADFISVTSEENGGFIMENEMKRINALEEKVEDHGVYVKTETSMNMGILEDNYDNIDDEVTWVILYAKEMAKKVKSLEKQLNMKDRMHSES